MKERFHGTPLWRRCHSHTALLQRLEEFRITWAQSANTGLTYASSGLGVPGRRCSLGGFIGAFRFLALHPSHLFGNPLYT